MKSKVVDRLRKLNKGITQKMPKMKRVLPFFGALFSLSFLLSFSFSLSFVAYANNTTCVHPCTGLWGVGEEYGLSLFF